MKMNYYSKKGKLLAVLFVLFIMILGGCSGLNDLPEDDGKKVLPFGVESLALDYQEKIDVPLESYVIIDFDRDMTTEYRAMIPGLYTLTLNGDSVATTIAWSKSRNDLCWIVPVGGLLSNSTYIINLVNQDVIGTYDLPITFTTVDIVVEQLAEPGISVVGKTENSITVSLTSIASADGYEFERYLDDTGTVYAETVISGTREHTFTGLDLDTEYGFRGKATSSSAEYTDSAWSALIVGKTNPEPEEEPEEEPEPEPEPEEEPEEEPEPEPEDEPEPEPEE